MKTNKIFILSMLFVLMTFTIFKSVNVYAYNWTDEEVKMTKTKWEADKLYTISNIYVTKNIDTKRVVESISKYLIWEGSFPKEDKANDIYMEFGEYISDSDSIVLSPHLGYNQPVFNKMIKPKVIESYDSKAEYLIATTNYDQVLIIIDGNTYKDNLGDLVNDLLSKEKEYQISPTFYQPYKYAAKEDGSISYTRYKDKNGDIYQTVCKYLVGFNLTKESTQTNLEDNVDDPSIYGGNDDVQIDDTPTEKETNQNQALKIVGIIISSILSILGLYLIYLLIKRIYRIMKG